MKLSKDELISKINEATIDDEIKISLLEDISDSMDVQEVDNTELESIKTKYDELKEKYKERFLKGNDEKTEEKEDSEEKEELKEEEVIDVKEI